MMKREGESVFRVQGAVHFLISLRHNLTELSNQDADEEMRRWAEPEQSWRVPPAAQRYYLSQLWPSEPSQNCPVQEESASYHSGAITERDAFKDIVTPDENPPLSQTFQSISPFQHASWRLSGPLGVSQRRATSGGVVSGCPRTRLTRQDGLCNLTSAGWRPWSASCVFRHLLYLTSTISHRFTLWNTSSGVTELSKPVHLGDVILLPAWVWPWLVVCHLPSVAVSCSTHIRHNLHLWPAGWGAAGVGAGDHGLKPQEAL